MQPSPSRARSALLEESIFVIRYQKVILDIDLAKLYGVRLSTLTRWVTPQRDRFPSDFCFQLTEAEKAKLCDDEFRFRRLRRSQRKPHAFTEHGALLAAMVLSGNLANGVRIELIRSFLGKELTNETNNSQFGKLEALIGHCASLNSDGFQRLRMKTIQQDIPIQPVDNPIICNPYDEPNDHWFYDESGQATRPGHRRPAGYWYRLRE